MDPKVYSYVRFSDIRQSEGASSARQEAYAAKWAQDHGLELDEKLKMRDEGLSAFHQQHVIKGALGHFLRAVESGAVKSGSVLVVEGLDRLSRAEPMEAQAQLTSIISAGITVVTASDGRTYNRESLKANPYDIIAGLLVMIRANEESETKSRRVRDAIRRQCEGWINGTYRGFIRYGNTPGWLRVANNRWELIPERAKAVLTAVDLFRSGAGAGHIAKQLHSAGLAVSAAEANSGHIVRLLAQPALTGEKRLSLGDERFVLDGYYPALLDKVTFEEVRLLAESRGRKRVKGDIPSLLTGFGVTVCGYCGSAMKSQTMANKRRPDGTLADGHRRLQCVRINSGTGCNVKGSCSSAPLERALMRYCSDMINLESLYAGDRAAVPKAELSIARQQLTEIDRRLGRLAEALMEGGDKISAFVSRAHTLQKEQANMQARVKALEVSLAEVTRSDISGLDQSWRRLETGVENLAFESRMQARQLVSDTFERIVVYHHGVRPNDTPKGTIDVILRAKGGTSRMLRIDKLANWTLSEDFFDPAATPSTLVSDGSSL